MNAGNFINYFKDCYSAEHKEFVIDNILATKYRFKWYAEGEEELLAENCPRTPFLHPKIEELAKELELYRLEKSLFYGCFYLLGRANKGLAKDKRICAPLLLFPAEVVDEQGNFYLQINREELIVNRSVLSHLELSSPQYTKDDVIGELTSLVLNTDNNLLQVRHLLLKYFKNIDTEELLLYPTLWTKKMILAHFKKEEQSELKIVPAAGTIWATKTDASLKVLNDLQSMGENADWSQSLEALIEGKDQALAFDFSFKKNRLNTEQYQALGNTYRYKNSVIIGPPGTGKSYTITSIVADAVINNKTVLLVSKSKQALSVLKEMLERDFKLKDYLISSVTHAYRYHLQRKLKSYLSGIVAKAPTKEQHLDIEKSFSALQRLEAKFESAVARELALSKINFGTEQSLLDKLKKVYWRYAFKGTEIWILFKEIQETTQVLEQTLKQYSSWKMQKNIQDNFQTYRSSIATFYQALSSSNFTNYKALIENADFEKVLKVFPIWLVHLSDLNAVLPLQKDLFDTVIFDEATQCDVASALPAIYRAKSSVIVGDPHQLRHYSFVSKTQQEFFQRKYNLPNSGILDYRNQSVLDLYINQLQQQDQITFLREHFRSTPSLIEFSNKYFYEGQLQVLKSVPQHSEANQIELIDVKGHRNSKGINEEEAQAILHKLDELIEAYQKNKNTPSIGIIAPFKTQVDHINKCIRDRYTLKIIKQFHLLCGTPYHFQGAEREIILLSLTVCRDTHASAFVHANKAEVLNVAVTRAKSYQYVYKSIGDKDLKQDSNLSNYIHFIRNFVHHAKEEEKDKFQEEIVEALGEIGVKDIRCGYPVAGVLLDILVKHKKQSFFIDLIGYPGGYQEAFSLERYKTLGRSGIRCLPLHYSSWQRDPQAVKKYLKDFILES